MTNKDASIQTIVKHLQTKFGKTEILLQDHWDGDNFAIGLTDKTQKLLIYISTLGKENNRLFVALERPSIDNAFPYIPAGDFDNITIGELEQIVCTHFKINF